jgi:hypothetical protein
MEVEGRSRVCQDWTCKPLGVGIGAWND